MTNPADYKWWRNALFGNIGPIHDDEPQCGYYRNRSVKHNIDQPVAIWKTDAGVVARAGFSANAKMVDAGQIWTFVCRSPITHEFYTSAFEGGTFPDALPPIGHNLSSDPREALAMELEGEAELAKQFLASPITTQEDADRAATWATKLSKIASKADGHRKVEKQPHLDAGAAVDAAWNPIRDGAKELSTRLKRHLDPFLKEQARKERERQEAAEREAEKARQKAERAAREADDAAKAVGADAAAVKAAKEAEERAAEIAREAEQSAKARNAQAGHTGNKVALRTHTYAEITDFDALLNALKDRKEVHELVETLANRAARSGVELPGMSIQTEKRAA